MDNRQCINAEVKTLTVHSRVKISLHSIPGTYTVHSTRTRLGHILICLVKVRIKNIYIILFKHITPYCTVLYSTIRT